MSRAKETGLARQVRDLKTSTSPQSQSTPALYNPATVHRSYPPLTTQFSVRDVCRYLFSSDGQSVFPDGVTVTYSTSDRFNQDFSSCQPSGWATSDFQFSPAVCPSDWTYNDMRTIENGVSQAFCCASGFSYYTDLTDCGSMAAYGPGTTAETRTTTDTQGQVHTETAKTLYLHRAWQIEWEASDTAGLPVSLPELTSGTVIAEWQPSSTTTGGGILNGNGSDSGGDDYGFSYTREPRIPIPSIVILAVVPTLILLGIGFCCFKHWRGKKKEKAQASEGVALGGVMSGNEEAVEGEQQREGRNNGNGGSRRQIKQMPRYL